MTDLKEDLRDSIQESSMAAELDEITARPCASDDYDGVQYNIFGTFVPIRPVIDLIASIDGKRIQHIHHTNEGDGGNVCLGVFVADVGDDFHNHPAFV